VFDPDEEPVRRAGHIRFGLKAIKGAGGKAIESIISERDTPAGDELGAKTPYTSLFDFTERVPPGTVNKATIEALVKAGAFDSVHGRDRRSSMVATIEQAVSAGQRAAQDKAAGQNQLFGFGGGDDADTAPDAPAEETPLASAPAWTESETLRQEKDTLGFYVSSHPLEEWADWTKVFCRLSCSTLKQQPQDKRVVLPALVQSVRTIVTKSGRSAGQKMGILMLEDTTGHRRGGHVLQRLRAVRPPRRQRRRRRRQPVFVMGRVDHSRGDPQVIVDKLVPIDGQPLEKGRLLIALRGKRLNGTADAAMDRVRGLLIEHDPAAAHANTTRARERGRRRRGERLRPLRGRQRRGGGPLRPRRRDRVRLRHAEPRVQGPRPARPGSGQGTLHRPGPRVGPPARRRLGRGEQGRPAQVPAPAGVRRTRHHTARATAVPAVPREG
jgi:DNA polymerase-3 subunit alpha